MDRVFADPNSVLSLERLREFLTSTAATRQFHVLVAQDSEVVIGGSVFSFVPGSRCGFSEYLLLDDANRGQGLGRLLFDRRKAILGERAGPVGCRGVFIEVDNPMRTPGALVSASGLDALARLRLFRHLGFRRVNLRYVQPPLGPGKLPVAHMDLLFAAWQPPGANTIPTEWIVQTLEPIWSAWTPELAGEFLTDLRRRVQTAEVDLLDPLSGLDSS
jgi:hypothetical protein